ncbi:MAG: ABC transporter permease [Halieaceae bacterium]|jgi:putative ABC transport system permease protein|nr:ABC transporter permease [Halieaceae bacterium]
MLVNLAMALKALERNRLQASLTLSGMAIGVAMVVIVAGLGRGAQLRIEDSIERAGPTRITIRAGNFQPTAIAAAAFEEGSGGGLSQGGLGDGGGDPVPGDADSIAAALALREEKEAAARAAASMKIRSPAAPLSLEELDLLATAIPGVRAASGSIEANVRLDEAVGSRVRAIRLHGYQQAWPEMAGWRVRAGRGITPAEHDGSAPVAVITAATAARMWPDAEAIGQTLQVNGFELSVVGIVAIPGSDSDFVLVPDVFVPLALAQTLIDRRTLDRIDVRSVSVAQTSAVAETITETLRRQRGLPDDTLSDFRVETQSTSAMPGLGTDPRLAMAVQSNVVEFEKASWEEMARSLRRAGNTFTALLSAAAAVSLLVGGIGVMNVMLVSVTARTREIGLRMAMGARVRDVLVQFLVEAVTLAVLGGLIGLLVGAGALWTASRGLDWATSLSPGMLFLGMAVAAVTGIVFGYGPANRAARLDPVVALRSE